jgi:hypothetical protein
MISRKRSAEMVRRYLACLLGLGGMLMAFPSLSANLPPPAGKTILIVSGKITNSNTQQGVVFDRAMLEQLGTDTVRTRTPWHDGEVTFSGVRLDKLMAYVGAEGRSVTAVALNDYVTTIPIDDFSRFQVILALKRNGEYMSVRDKGPLFIIYPFDSDSTLQSQVYFGRSAWQVAKLVVE